MSPVFKSTTIIDPVIVSGDIPLNNDSQNASPFEDVHENESLQNTSTSHEPPNSDEPVEEIFPVISNIETGVPLRRS